jgi:hypothetical protein
MRSMGESSWGEGEGCEGLAMGGRWLVTVAVEGGKRNWEGGFI